MSILKWMSMAVWLGKTHSRCRLQRLRLLDLVGFSQASLHAFEIGSEVPKDPNRHEPWSLLTCKEPR